MKTLKQLPLIALFIFAFSACKKDSEPTPVPEPESDFEQVDQYTKKYKNGVVEISYYPMDITLPTTSQYAYYSFDKMGFIKSVDPKTDNWDIVFQSLSSAYYGTFACHYGKASSNGILWATGTDAFNVKGGYILKTFYELETVPADFTYSMSTKSGIVAGSGTKDDPAFANGAAIGYFVNNTETGLPIYMVKYTNKCYIFKLTDGRFVKFDLINVYNNKPADNNKDSKPGYLSFRYYVAKAGSTDVKTK